MKKTAFSLEMTHLDALDIAFIDSMSDSYNETFGEFTAILPSELPENVHLETSIDDVDLAFGLANRYSIAL